MKETLATVFQRDSNSECSGEEWGRPYKKSILLV